MKTMKSILWFVHYNCATGCGTIFENIFKYYLLIRRPGNLMQKENDYGAKLMQDDL